MAYIFFIMYTRTKTLFYIAIFGTEATCRFFFLSVFFVCFIALKKLNVGFDKWWSIAVGKNFLVYHVKTGITLGS